MYNNGCENEYSKKSTPEQSAEKPEKNSRNSFRQLLKQFASDTSFGGISKVTLSDGHFRRFVWTLISAMCYGFTIYMCYGLIVNYLDKPISTTVDIAYERVSFSLCITLPFKLSIYTRHIYHETVILRPKIILGAHKDGDRIFSMSISVLELIFFS